MDCTILIPIAFFFSHTFLKGSLNLQKHRIALGFQWNVIEGT